MRQEVKVIGGIVLATITLFGGIIYYESNRKGTPENPVSPEILITPESHPRGPENAKVTIVEFADYECPACYVTHPIVEQVLASFGDSVRFVYRNFPLHANSVLAAKAAEAAGAQGKYWQMHAKLFEGHPMWANKSVPQTEIFVGYAQELGLDISAFRASLESDAYEKKIDDDKEDGIAAGVLGTPTFFINGVILQGVPNYAQLESRIKAELAK